MKKIYLTIFVCCFTATIFAQDKTNTIRENDQFESPEHVKIEQISKVAQNNAATTVVSYDFTTTPDGQTPGSQFHGGAAAAKQMPDGKWAMIAGDANGDGSVLAEDYILYQTSQGQEGYNPVDFNLDGSVLAEDYIIYQINQGRETKVPSL